MLAQSVSLVVDQARDKELELTVTVAPDVPSVVLGDPVRLGQVVTNLASNAVKFTAVGEVDVRASWADGLLRVEVQDTGIGVAPEVRDKLFTPFTQADSSTTRTYGGTGLGLAISSRIVAATGGEIGVEPGSEIGSTFWFTMRLAASEVPPELPDLPEPLAEDDEQRGAGRVLVVEDNAINQLVAEGMLRRLGYDVVLAGNGSVAVAWVAVRPLRRDPDGLPDAGDGRLRRHPGGAGAAGRRAAHPDHRDDRRRADRRARALPRGRHGRLPHQARRGERARRGARPLGAEGGGPDLPTTARQVAARLGEFLDDYGVDLAVVTKMVDALRRAGRHARWPDCGWPGSREEVARHAHSLRGGATNLGLAGVAAVCAELEATASRRPRPRSWTGSRRAPRTPGGPSLAAYLAPTRLAGLSRRSRCGRRPCGRSSRARWLSRRGGEAALDQPQPDVEPSRST